MKWQRTVTYEIKGKTFEQAHDSWEQDGPEVADTRRVALAGVSDIEPVDAHERAESLTSEQLDQELIAHISAQLAHLSRQYSSEDQSDEATALGRALDAWDEFVNETKVD